MLLVSVRDKRQPAGFTPVKCPRCKHGRVCDSSAPFRRQAPHSEPDRQFQIVVKCPTCGTPVALTIE